MGCEEGTGITPRSGHTECQSGQQKKGGSRNYGTSSTSVMHLLWKKYVVRISSEAMGRNMSSSTAPHV